MKVVFFGTPEIAVLPLQALIEHRETEVVGAVTQPDRPSGRGHKLHAPPVKLICQQHNIPVYQPEKLSKAPEVFEALSNLEPDLIVMVAFGQILKKDVLALPKQGVINLHASLLPAYRGAAPINWAIINGETSTGISTMFTEAGLDTGPMLLKEEIPLDMNINSQELTKIMADRGAKLVIKTIEQLIRGNLIAEPQDDRKATYAPILDKSIGKINWSAPAHKIHNLVRGIIPWPLAVTNFRGNQLKIWRTAIVSAEQTAFLKDSQNSPGAIKILNKQLFVCCGEGSWLEINEVQPANKPKLAVKDWINGFHIDGNENFVSIENQTK